MSYNNVDNLKIVASFLNKAYIYRDFNVNYVVGNICDDHEKQETIVAKCDGFKLQITDVDVLNKIQNKTLTFVELNKMIERHITIMKSSAHHSKTK